MKTSKFGKLQKSILQKVVKRGARGTPLSALHTLAFPGNTYPFSYVVPVLLRMEHQGLLKINWGKARAYPGRYKQKGGI